MKKTYNIKWFKDNISELLCNYDIEYKSFKNGDFGALNQVEFNSDKIGGNIDFWGLDWLGVFLWDYKKEIELINVLLEPSEYNKKEEIINDLLKILNNNNEVV